MYEYEPPNADISIVPTGFPDACFVTDPNIVLGKPDPDDADANPAWAADQGTCQAAFTWAGGAQLNPEHHRITATIPHAGYLVLHLERYPAWFIRLNEQVLTSELASGVINRNDGLIAIPVPRGPIDLTVDWTTSPGDLAGRWLTVLSALLLIALSLCEHRLGRSRLT